MAFGIKVQPDMAGFKALGGFEAFGPKKAMDVMNRASERTARVTRVMLQQAYKQGMPDHEALHPFTLVGRNGEQPLRNEGRFERNIELFVIRKGSRIDYLVGFSDPIIAGRAIANEEGTIIVVTDPMRMFLAANGFPLRADTAFLFVPPRPVFAAVAEATPPIHTKFLQEEFAAALGPQNLQSSGSTSLFSRLASSLRKMFG